MRPNVTPGERVWSVRLVLRYDVPRDDREAATSLVDLAEALVADAAHSPLSVELLQPLLGGGSVVYELHLSFASHAEVGAWVDRLETEQPSRKMWDPGTPLADRVRSPHASARLRDENAWPVHRVRHWVARRRESERSSMVDTPTEAQATTASATSRPQGS